MHLLAEVITAIEERTACIYCTMLGMVCISHMNQLKFGKWSLTYVAVWQRSTSIYCTEMHLTEHNEALFAIFSSLIQVWTCHKPSTALARG